MLRDVRSLTHTFFAPAFLLSIGLEINAREAGSQIGLFLLILAIAVPAKGVGYGLGAWVSGFKWRESLVVGVGMFPPGEGGLITASLGAAAGLITPAVYSLMVVMVLATTLLTPALLRLVIPWQNPISSAIPEIGPEIDSTG